MGFIDYRKAFDYVNNIKSLGKSEFQNVSLLHMKSTDRTENLSLEAVYWKYTEHCETDSLQIGKGMRHYILSLYLYAEHVLREAELEKLPSQQTFDKLNNIKLSHVAASLNNSNILYTR